MGENQGVIWIIVGSLVLGAAVWGISKMLSAETANQAIDQTYIKQQAIDEGLCETQDYEDTGSVVSGVYTFVGNDNPDWDATDDATWDINGQKQSAITTTTGHEAILATGVCNFS